MADSASGTFEPLVAWSMTDLEVTYFGQYVIVNYLIFSVVFVAVGGMFTVLDWTQALRGYKTQPETNEPLDVKKFQSLLKQVLVNQLIVSPLFLACMGYLQIRLGLMPDQDLPQSVPRVMRDMLGCAIIEELLFYYFHLVLHHRSVYKFVHKRHHEWTAPVAFAAVYAHPLEHVVSNLLPLALGPVIMRASLVTTRIWICSALSITLIHHSGYHLPFLPSPEFHDYHHLKFNQNFGVLGILDYIHGTDLGFRSDPAFRRHKIFFTLRPAREVFPDKKKD